ncbi:putative transcription factor C3H family [Helianthus anomalus]
MNPHEPPYVNNRRTTYIFYKTRMCQRFAEGDCPNGDSCTFAHGPKDLREPPPNWQELANDNRSPGIWKDDEKIIKKMRICRNFYNREICPYGEKCTFLHESPDKFKFQPTNDNGGSSGIKVETVVDHGQRQTIVGQDSVKTHGLAGSSTAANAVPGPITTEPPATSSASVVPVTPPRLGRGFLKLAGKKLVGIYGDWIDEEEEDNLD